MPSFSCHVHAVCTYGSNNSLRYKWYMYIHEFVGQCLLSVRPSLHEWPNNQPLWDEDQLTQWSQGTRKTPHPRGPDATTYMCSAYLGDVCGPVGESARAAATLLQQEPHNSLRLSPLWRCSWSMNVWTGCVPRLRILTPAALLLYVQCINTIS